MVRDIQLVNESDPERERESVGEVEEVEREVLAPLCIAIVPSMKH